MVFLSTGERLTLIALYRIVALPERVRGRVTTARLAEITGNRSRGQVWNHLSRIRQLGLAGFRAYPVMERTGRDRKRLGGARRPSPGCEGRLLVWIPSPARVARRRALDDSLTWREAVRIALTSTRFSGFSGKVRAESWWGSRLQRGSGGPPVPRPPGGGPAGPPRAGRRPPIAIRARCPAGHVTAAGRWSWREGPPVWSAEYRGRCRPCGVDVLERLVVELPPEPARPDSPAELAEPGLRARRGAAAAEILAAPDLVRPLGQRVRLERDYL